MKKLITVAEAKEVNRDPTPLVIKREDETTETFIQNKVDINYPTTILIYGVSEKILDRS